MIPGYLRGQSGGGRQQCQVCLCPVHLTRVGAVSGRMLRLVLPEVRAGDWMLDTEGFAQPHPGGPPRPDRPPAFNEHVCATTLRLIGQARRARRK